VVTGFIRNALVTAALVLIVLAMAGMNGGAV
jgi:hypothetical protein